MSFISFLTDLKAYIPSLGDAVKVGFSQTILPSTTNQGAANLITSEETTNTFTRPANKDYEKTKKGYEEDNGALFYPEDLFLSGNEAYILFYMRDSVYKDAKLMKRIALYMPPSVAVNYGANWQQVDMLIRKDQQDRVKVDVENILNHFANADIKAAIDSLLKAFGLNGSATGALMTAALKRGAQSLMTNTGIGQAASFIAQKSINPMTALSFTNVNLRQFKFKFELMARSANESDSINYIINCFKYGMHPGSTDGGSRPASIPSSVNGAVDSVFLNYPNTFDVYLFSPGSQYMFQIQRSVLLNMDVQYNGNDVASFFKGTGAPTNITLELHFQETELLTKERIVLGY